MSSQAIVERRRVAIIDGDRRYDLVLPGSVSVDAVLTGLGASSSDGRQRMLVDHEGREVPSTARGADLTDGVVLTVVDPSEALPARARSASSASRNVDAMTAVWWLLGAAGLLLGVVGLLVPDSIGPSLRVILAVAAATGAVASAAAWALRRGGDHSRAVTAAAPLALAFGAGVIAIPPLPASAVQLALLCGLACAAVLAGLLGLLVRSAAVRAALGTVTLILLALAAVWGLALLLEMPVSAPAAVSLGAVPVALRALPTTLLDVPPGMFIDYRRFQRTRWTVRQAVPADGEPIGARTARDLVDRSSGRLLVGTAMLSLIAAASAPFAVPGFDTPDPIVLAGRIAVLCCAASALLLGARRASAPLLRWMPRAAAVVVIGVAVVAAASVAGSVMLALASALLFLAGVAAAFAVIPAARGFRSLGWSRFGDIVEVLAVVLSLPAGLLAADVLNLLRGMMGG